MFLQWGQQYITFSLSAFFLPLDPSYPVQLHLQCSLSSHPNLSTLSSRLSFVLLFSISAQLCSFQDVHTYLLSSAFLFLVVELTPASPCVLLYMSSALTTPLEPLSLIKSRLKCSLPVSEGFSEG